MSNAPSTSWPTRGLGRVADYKPFTLVDGPGIRCAVYFSGCFFACGGCYNKKIQSFRAGHEADHSLMVDLTEHLARPYVQGVSLLGGEPFSNTDLAMPVAELARFLGKNVWTWTGFEYEWLLENASDDQAHLLSITNVLVDGPYREDLRSVDLKYRGSRNQRVIDVADSLRRKRVVNLDVG